MAKATKEVVLNYAMNNWQLNYKRNVGPTSDSIRLCAPSSLQEWENYYFSNVRTRDHLEMLGRKLYEHIRNDVPREERFFPALVDSITEQDCIDYMYLVVIKRTYDGYKRERGLL